jgi:hypothetical protein
LTPWITTQGYRAVYNTNRKSRKALEHILVYEKSNQCCVLPWSNIHHINGNKTDNRPENLEAMTAAQHTRIHTSKIPNDRRCNNCQSITTQADRHGGLSWFRDRNTGLGFWCQKCYMVLYWRPKNPNYKREYLAKKRRQQRITEFAA